jgi:hypothetical protein
MASQAIRDTTNCPRHDGGHLRFVGNHSRDRYDPEATEPHYECSTCGRWWTNIELDRVEAN